MSSPSLNPNTPIIVKVLTDLVVGALIRNSNPAVETARAQLVITVASSLSQAASSGDPTAIMNAVDAAIEAVVAKSSDPAIASVAAIAISWVATKATAFQQFLGGTIVGSLNGVLLSQAATEATTLAQKYLPAPAPATVY